MKLTASKLNKFLFFKLPSFICGVGKKLDETDCVVTVKHRWINQNRLIRCILQFRPWLQSFQQNFGDVSNSKKRKKISMLVANNKGSFTKKATGRITFVCKTVI
jgi:hypothetical protein